MQRISCENCPACGSEGHTRYSELKDTVFGASGAWFMKGCNNSTCGMLWLDPAPDPRDIHEAYHSYYTHGDPVPKLKRWSAFRSFYHSIQAAYWHRKYGYRSLSSPSLSLLLKPLAFLIPYGTDSIGVEVMFLDSPTKGARLLEVGCGDGRTLRRMRELGWEVEAIEFDPACILELNKYKVKAYQGDIRSVSLAADTYDAIYLGNVIEHVYDPASFLEECLRVLKPGGRIVLLTPNSLSWGHRHYRQDWRGLEPPRHIQVFNHSNLAALLSSCGFCRVLSRTTNRGGWYILGASEVIRETRIRSQNFEAERVIKLSWRGIRFQIWGRIITLVRPLSGEEIFATAWKPAQ